MRVRYGMVTLPRGQRPGRWEDLSDDDVNALRKSVGLSAKVTRGDKTRGGFSRKAFTNKPASSKKRATGSRKPAKGRR
jgi:hypothetical protein